MHNTFEELGNFRVHEWMLLAHHPELHLSLSMRCHLCIQDSVTYQIKLESTSAPMNKCSSIKVSISDTRNCSLPNIYFNGLCLCLLFLGWGRRARKTRCSSEPKHLNVNCVKDSISGAVTNRSTLSEGEGPANLHRRNAYSMTRPYRPSTFSTLLMGNISHCKQLLLPRDAGSRMVFICRKSNSR